jgi:hypothetical protein
MYTSLLSSVNYCGNGNRPILVQNLKVASGLATIGNRGAAELSISFDILSLNFGQEMADGAW